MNRQEKQCTLRDMEAHPKQEKAANLLTSACVQAVLVMCDAPRTASTPVEDCRRLASSAWTTQICTACTLPATADFACIRHLSAEEASDSVRKF